MKLFSHKNINHFMKFEKRLKYFVSVEPANFTVLGNIWCNYVNESTPVTSPAVTRSRSTDKELKRTLSDTGIGNEISPQVTAAIELAVNKAISSQQLMADISASLRDRHRKPDNCADRC
ncbi:hypothetical protein J6590_050763 [Homalodisca vitripennis]|nr:hypothetical protein J6590_050763 [Homalodisca vitripennis]